MGKVYDEMGCMGMFWRFNEYNNCEGHCELIYISWHTEVALLSSWIVEAGGWPLEFDKDSHDPNRLKDGFGLECFLVL